MWTVGIGALITTRNRILLLITYYYYTFERRDIDHRIRKTILSGVLFTIAFIRRF